MAVVGTVNYVVGSSAGNAAQEWCFEFKELLTANGWTVVASGDGSATYNASGDAWATVTSLAAGAWAVLRPPSTNYEILLEYVGTTIADIYVSPIAFSDPGGAGAAVRWTSAHEVNQAHSFSVVTTPKYHFITTDANVDGERPIYWFRSHAGGLDLGGAVEVLDQNTRHPLLASPVVFIPLITTSWGSGTAWVQTESGSITTFGAANTHDFRDGSTAYYQNTALQIQQDSGKKVMFPPWLISADKDYFSGTSEYLNGPGTQILGLPRTMRTPPTGLAYPDRVLTVSAGDWVYVSSGVVVPWPTGVVPT